MIKEFSDSRSMRLDVAGDSTLPGSDQLGLVYRQILASHSPVIEEQGWGSRGRYGRGQAAGDWVAYLE